MPARPHRPIAGRGAGPYLSVGAGRQDGNGLIHRGQQRPQGQADLLTDESAVLRAADPARRLPFRLRRFLLPPPTVENTATRLSLCLEPRLLSYGVIFPPRLSSACSSRHESGSGARDRGWRRSAPRGFGAAPQGPPLLLWCFLAQKGPHAGAGEGTRRVCSARPHGTRRRVLQLYTNGNAAACFAHSRSCA